MKAPLKTGTKFQGGLALATPETTFPILSSRLHGKQIVCRTAKFVAHRRKCQQTKTMNTLDPKGAIGATKTPLHLLPPVAMEAWAWAQKDGADRYGPYNWRSVQVCATTYISAMMRHLDAFRDGEDRTKDSKVFHLGAIMANCAILLDAAAAGTLVDDRFKMPERGECLIHRSPDCCDCGGTSSALEGGSK